MDLLFSGGTAAGDADLPLLVSREKAGLWNATASVRVVVVALPQEAAASEVATAMCCGGRDRSVEAGGLEAGADAEEEMEVGLGEGVR